MANMVVTRRSAAGKRACKKMRKSGQVPGVIYGQKKDVIHIEFPHENILALLTENILKLELEDGQEDVIIKDVQYDTFGEEILHVDFHRIDLDQRITVSIPIKFIGVPIGTQRGGVWEKHLAELLISCIPDKIPHSIDINIEHLDIDQHLRVKDIEIGIPSVKIEVDEEILITSVHAAKEESEDGEEQSEEPQVIKQAKEQKE